MNSQQTVLLVDDDPDLVNVHSTYLALLGFTPVTATDGKEALCKLANAPDTFDIILSDVEMPNMSGYDFCRAVKDNDATRDIPFLFVSSHNTLEEKLKGYGVGGDDYITKPITPQELSIKITTLLDARKKSQTLSARLAETHNTAMQAMSYSSDLGQVLEFYKNSLTAESFEQLAALLFDVTKSYGLNVTLQILAPGRVISLTERGPATPLEANVIELSRSRGRFFDFGSRTVINYDDFSLLIKNMPINDPNRYGAVKDTLGSLCNAIEARVKVLISNDVSEQNERVLEAVKTTLSEVEALFNKVQHANVCAIQLLTDELEEAMLTTLGLNEDQEDSIRAIAKKCLESTNETYDEGMKLSGMFDNINSQLKNILGVNA